MRLVKFKFRSAATEVLLSVEHVVKNSIAPIVALPCMPAEDEGIITAVAFVVRFPAEGIAVLVPFVTPFQLVRLPLPNWCDAVTKLPLNV